MAGEGHLAVGKPFDHIAVGIVTVADVFAATKTGDVLQGVRMVDSVSVRLLNLRTLLLREGGETARRDSLEQVTVGSFP